MPDPKTPDSKLRELIERLADSYGPATVTEVRELAEAAADEVAALKNRFDAQAEWDASVSRRLDEIERRLDDADYPADLRNDIPEQRERVRQINKRLRGEHDMPTVDASGKPPEELGDLPKMSEEAVQLIAGHTDDAGETARVLHEMGHGKPTTTDGSG